MSDGDDEKKAKVLHTRVPESLDNALLFGRAEKLNDIRIQFAICHAHLRSYAGDRYAQAV